MEQEELLRKIAAILDDLDIPYIITGGIAVVIWGRPRFTADIDIVIELTRKNLDRLAERLLDIDKEVYVDRESMERALERHGEFNFIHPAAGLKVDFWILRNDAFDRERMRRRVRRRIAGTDIFLTSPEDLILIKLLWYKESGSTRQLEDVESVFKIQKKLDWKYIRKWARVHATLEILNTLWNKIKKE